MSDQHQSYNQLLADAWDMGYFQSFTTNDLPKDMTIQDRIQAMRTMNKQRLEQPYAKVVDDILTRSYVIGVPAEMYTRMMLSSIGHIKPTNEIYVQECLNLPSAVNLEIIEEDKNLKDFCIFKLSFVKGETNYELYNLGFIGLYFVKLSSTYNFPYHQQFVSSLLFESDQEVKQIYYNFLIMYAQAIENNASTLLGDKVMTYLDKEAKVRYPKWTISKLRSAIYETQV